MAWQLCGTKIELDLRHVTHCHTHTAATLTYTLCFTHTHSLSLSVAHTYKQTYSQIWYQPIALGRQKAGDRLDSLRPSASQRSNFRLVVTLFTFIHFYSAFISTFSAIPRSTPPLPARLCMSHSLLLCLRLEMRFENLQKHKWKWKMKHTYNTKYRMLFVKIYKYLLNICNKFVYINLVFQVPLCVCVSACVPTQAA